MNEFLENWITQVRKGVLELSVLNALCAEQLYGYAIVDRLRTIPGLMVSEGTVYPLLSRLEGDGWLESSFEPSPAGPPRKYYRLTRRGEAVLTEMNERWDLVVEALEGLRRIHDVADD